jgi:signal transduction histidine kinase
VVVAHGGTTELRAPEEGGLVVAITLPAAPQPAGTRAEVPGLVSAS